MPQIIPNTFGEQVVLKLMFDALTRAVERCRSVKVTDFKRRPMDAILDSAVHGAHQAGVTPTHRVRSRT